MKVSLAMNFKSVVSLKTGVHESENELLQPPFCTEVPGRPVYCVVTYMELGYNESWSVEGSMMFVVFLHLVCCRYRGGVKDIL